MVSPYLLLCDCGLYPIHYNYIDLGESNPSASGWFLDASLGGRDRYGRDPMAILCLCKIHSRENERERPH